MPRGIFVATALLLLAGCASAGTAGAAHTSRGSSNVITAAELAAKPELTNAYEAVQMLRPQFLRSHGQTSFNSTSSGDASSTLPVVFMDNQQFGNVESLRQIPISDVGEIRYLSPSEATTQWGTGYTNGVIQVIRKTG